MKMTYNKSSVSLLLAFMLFWAGCTSTEECREDLTVSLKAGLYNHSDSKETALTVDSVWLNGLEKDSFLYKNSKKLTAVNFVLDAGRTQSDFVIQFNDIKDTISVFYTNNNGYFISLACGCISAHTIDEVITTHHYIDSVRIVQREVINVNAEHIKIFHN